MTKTKSRIALIITFVLSLCIFGAEKQPNIVWICIEDASCHIGSYGEKAIKTPVLDQLASEGIQFDQAFVTAPVCSSSRSAMVTGMYQMTSGFHHHRSQRKSGKGGANKLYFDSYKISIPTVPELFKKAGYYVTNKSKTDYNFIADKMYDGSDWQKRKAGQPFFAQFQLHGGKSRGSSKGVDTSKMKIPPYYKDDEVIRKDWASYLGSWVKTDSDVKKILDSLDKAGELENTYIFVWTDHGVSHIRGKQFLYDEGIKVPLIVRFPNKVKAGSVRKDQVTHIDIPVSSLVLAGIKVPDYMQGKDIFATDYKEQLKIVCGRDRCDETVDFIRCVRTKKWKYIRNFLHVVSYMQPCQYKVGKMIVSDSRQLFNEGKLNKIQARAFMPNRPQEELYDLENDPHEINNLAKDPKHKAILEELREDLKTWMITNNDLGLIPEPILDDKGKAAGNKFSIMKDPKNKDLLKDILTVVDACDAGNEERIKVSLSSTEPTIRFWAARTTGSLKISELKDQLKEMLKDKDGTVRTAAAQSLYQLGDKSGLHVLAKDITNENLLVGMYAIRALEAIGPDAKDETGDAIKAAKKSPYEFTKRVAKRLTIKWKL
jgi:arylsulfatase A-like enzyme